MTVDRPATDSHSELLSVRGLAKTFRVDDDNEVTALADVDLTVHRGEVVSIVGPSGCGKSTLLNIVAGLTKLTAGEVLVEGEAPKPRQEVGIMFQNPLLFPWRSVVENVLLPSELFQLNKQERTIDERAHELLELVELGDWSDSYPWQLSGGMQQRVALARVLLPDPDILLLDEPFGALDEMTREELDMELLDIATSRQKTVVLITHSIYEAVLISDRIHVMSRRPGTIVSVIDVPMPRPRTIEDSGKPEFAEKIAEVRSAMARGGQEVEPQS